MGVKMKQTLNTESVARSVFDEAANVYYPLVKDLPKSTKAKLSFFDLRAIFSVMVEPAIEKVRQLDRGYRSAEPAEE